jgi:glyoxylase-like metal-dependent hydrolase (beta-lactamase superfamily II)
MSIFEIHRKFFALTLLLTAFGIMSPLPGLPVLLGLYSVQEVKPKVFVWIPDDVIDQECDPLFPRAATAGFIVTTAGVVVVDTTNSPMRARDLLYDIRHRTDLPIRCVINTSSAGDHMLGNEVFSDQQATLISTRAAQAEMQRYRQVLAGRLRGEGGWRLAIRMRGFHVTPPTESFDEKMTLTVGEQEIRIISMLSSVTAGDDAVVYLPSAKTLFLGELYDNHFFPRIGSRDVHRWIEVLRQVEGWDVDTYVPGHGGPGSKKDLVDFRKFLEWLVAQVEMRLKQGQSPEQVQKTLWLPKTYNWHASDLAQDTVADVCRQLAPQHAEPAEDQPGQ